MFKTPITTIEDLIIMMHMSIEDGRLWVNFGKEYDACIALYELGKTNKDSVQYQTYGMDHFDKEEFWQVYQKMIDIGQIVIDTEGVTIH